MVCTLFWEKGFYLQGILHYINEQDTSFVDCKHKHMMKSGARPDKFIVHTVCLPIEFHGFIAELILKVITLWFLGLSQIF